MTRVELREVEAYAYASCQTCSWKLSRTGTGVDAEFVIEQADDHAEKEGHRVFITENRAIEFDYRVERSA